MAAKVLSFFALVACVVLVAEAKPQLLAAPAVYAAPVATLSHSAAYSAHPLPGTPFISGYSHQAIRQISRSSLLATPVVHAAPYVAAPYVSSPYVASPYYY